MRVATSISRAAKQLQIRVNIRTSTPVHNPARCHTSISPYHHTYSSKSTIDRLYSAVRGSYLLHDQQPANTRHRPRLLRGLGWSHGVMLPRRLGAGHERAAPRGRACWPARSSPLALRTTSARTSLDGHSCGAASSPTLSSPPRWVRATYRIILFSNASSGSVASTKRYVSRVMIAVR